MKFVLLILILVLLTACDSEVTANKSKAQQPTLSESLNEKSLSDESLGEKTFVKNCVVCHGDQGQGIVKDWKKLLPDGSYPAPPLNGTAHTWHHAPDSLLQTINDGGIQFGGSMPGFREKLNDKEKEALIKYMYDLWPKDIQARYDKHFKS